MSAASSWPVVRAARRASVSCSSSRSSIPGYCRWNTPSRPGTRWSGRGRTKPKAKRPGAQAAERGHRLAGVRGGGEHRLGMGWERLAGGGEPDPAPVSEEQALAEFGLEPADLLAD